MIVVMSISNSMEVGKEVLNIKAKDHLRKVLVIYHELPKEWHKIKCHGSVHFWIYRYRNGTNTVWMDGANVKC